MERCPTQAVLPLVGLAAEKVIRDRYVIPRPVRHANRIYSLARAMGQAHNDPWKHNGQSGVQTETIEEKCNDLMPDCPCSEL
ncbi:MAG: hypothetical protein R6U98_31500 [Pirellulaceae bacterium]